ncbi:retropepsin-like aspartic protease family protein [Haliea sp.]
MGNDVTEQKRLGTTMQVLAWVVLMALLAAWFNDLLGRRHNPNQMLETRYAEGGIREVVLQRNRFGHYVTSGRINGEPVVFMLDTGATGVAIPENIARRLKLERGRAFRTQTANGVAVSYATRLDRVSVGDIALDNVSAGIVPGLQTSEILLGMSFLKHIEFTQRGDQLILRQYPG